MEPIRRTLTSVGRLLRAAVLLTLLVLVVAGIPIGLWYFYGWPLPDHFPAIGEVTAWADQATVFPTQTALEVLVVVAWAFWALFTAQIVVQLPGVVADAVRCARTPTLAMPTLGSANLAGRLLYTIAISLLATRGTVSTAAAATTHSTAAPAARSVATAPATFAAVHIVVDGDSLWNIARDHLGDAERWPEIFKLNQHRVQADGQVLANPQLIQPGWVLSLPVGVAGVAASPSTIGDRAQSTTAPDPARTTVPAPITVPRSPAVSPTPHPATTTSSTSSNHIEHTDQQQPVVHRKVAVRLPTGGYVSLTLAAGLAAAYAAARLRSRVHTQRRDPSEDYEPAERPGEPEATLLRAAVLLGHADPEDDPYVDDGPAMSADEVAASVARTRTVRSQLAELSAPTAVYIGEQHGRPITLPSVSDGGLALHGDGAYDIARALLASALAYGGFTADAPTTRVITTADDMESLLGPAYRNCHTERLVITDSITEALDVLEDTTDGRHRPRLLLATSTQGASEQIAALASDSAGLDRYLVFLADCPDAGTRASIAADGSIQAIGTHASRLSGTQPYRLDLAEAQSLFGKLLVATGHPVPRVLPPTASPPTEPAIERRAQAEDPPQAAADVPVPRRASVAETPAPEAVTLDILGPVRIQVGNRGIDSTTRLLVTALLVYLALHPNGASSTTVAADLWPEIEDEKDRRNRLNTTMSHARTHLAAAYGSKPEFIPGARDTGRPRLNSKLFIVDSARFDALLKVRPAEGQGPETRIGALTEALELYRGDLAAGHEHAGLKPRPTDELWLRPHRDDYFRRAINAHHTLADLLSENQPDHAIDVLHRAISLDPFNQSLYEASIRVHIAHGQHAAAKRMLRDLTDVLAHMGLKPDHTVASLVAAAVA